MKLLLRFAHLPLDEIDDLLRLSHRAVPGDCSYDHVVLVEQNHRGRDSFTLRVWNDLRFAVSVDVRHGGERCPEVDSNSFAVGHEREIRNYWSAQSRGAARETVQFLCRKPPESRVVARSQSRARRFN